MHFINETKENNSEICLKKKLDKSRWIYRNKEHGTKNKNNKVKSMQKLWWDLWGACPPL